jgi:hypothetical protein
MGEQEDVANAHEGGTISVKKGTCKGPINEISIINKPEII